MKTLDCDYLIIGSGLAGLTAALHLSEHGKVVVATKKAPSESNSNYAQGGIAAVVADEDSFDLHVNDTITVGGALSCEQVIRDIVAEGPDRIQELVELGVPFERKEEASDEFDLGQEAGHSCRRILHAGDITGHEVIKVLLSHVEAHPNIELISDLMAIDLVTTGWLRMEGTSKCIGAYFHDGGSGAVMAIRAPVTLLASGGAGKVYLYTSNPDTATGDGIAMAWRAGLPIKNMEFVQFHPTCLFHPDAKSFLISEAVRGEGAELINEAGEAFMHRYDKRGALAPRDITARAIDNEIKTRGDTCVYLDITHRDKAFLTKRFPNIYAACKKYGLDMATDRIPVVPAAHYFCGGVEADVDGKTALEGLYACGEVTCTGLHGANRLASNSLLEAMVCAAATVKRVLNNKEASLTSLPDIPSWQYAHAVPSDEEVVVEHNWEEVRRCMWDYVGIVRTNKRLERAMRRVRNIRVEIREYYLDYLVTPDVLELRNLADVAELVIRSALLRRESRGLHFTLDFPEIDDRKPPRDTIITDPPGGSIALRFNP